MTWETQQDEDEPPYQVAIVELANGLEIKSVVARATKRYGWVERPWRVSVHLTGHFGADVPRGDDYAKEWRAGDPLGGFLYLTTGTRYCGTEEEAKRRAEYQMALVGLLASGVALPDDLRPHRA